MVKVVHLGAATALLICAVGVAATIPQPEGFQRFANELTRPWIGNVFHVSARVPGGVLLRQRCHPTGYGTVCEKDYADTPMARTADTILPAYRLMENVVEYLLSFLPRRVQGLPILLAGLLAFASLPSRVRNRNEPPRRPLLMQTPAARGAALNTREKHHG